MKNNQVARDVRVKLNDNWKPQSLSDEYLEKEPIIFICDNHIYNDVIGEYVFIKGGSKVNSGTAYLTQLDLEFPLSDDKPLYCWEDMKVERTYSTEEIQQLFEKLVVRNCFKSDRDYNIAKQTLLELTGIDYEDFN